MNLRWCFILILTLVFCGAGRTTAQAANADSPYETIVTRNVFGLVPIPIAPPPKAEPDNRQLPKITPNGIMTLFGKLQVLFKVATPGKPANQEDSYVMSVGDRQDDIEVKNIDEQSAVITFNNHGTIQELPLVAGKASTGAPPPANHGAPGQIPLPRPGIPAPRGGGASAMNSVGSHLGRGSSNLANIPAGGLGGTGAVGVNGAANQKITPEEQVIMIEANRLKAVQDGNPVAKLLPITPLTSQTLGEDGGNSGGGNANGQ